MKRKWPITWRSVGSLVVRTKTILKGKIDEPRISAWPKRCSIARQQKLYKVTLNGNCNDNDILKYKQYRNCLTKLKQYSKKNYYKNKCVEFNCYTRKLWKLINIALKKTSNKTSIIECIQTDKINEYKVDTIAETIAKYFANVGKEFASKIPRSSTTIGDYI